MSVQPSIPYSHGLKGLTEKVNDLNRRVNELQQQVGAIPPNSVSGDQITAGTLTTDLLAAGTITGDKIAAGTITADLITAGSITADQIAAGTITADLITTGTLTADKIAAGTITADRLVAGSITAGYIAAGTITASQIAATTITAGNIAAGTITAVQIAARSITADRIGVGVITGNEITAGTITASLISVSQLSAVAADMGLVTAGVFATGATGNRVLMGHAISTTAGTYAGVVGVDSSNNVTFLLDASTGNVTLKGTLKQGSTGLGNVQGTTQNAILMVSGNNLVVDGSALSTSMSMWNASIGSISRSTSQWLTAPASVQWTPGTSGTPSIWNLNVSQPSAAAKPYSAAAWVYHEGAAARDFLLYLGFNDVSLSRISNSLGPTVHVPPFEWTRVYVEDAIAPSGTLSVIPALQVGSVGAETYYTDAWLMVQNPSAQCSMVIADSITATEIAAGAVTASKISVTSLDALTANMGNLTAGTITGATYYTGAAYPRIQLDGFGLRAYDSSMALTLSIAPDGTMTLPQASSYTIQANPPGYPAIDTFVSVASDLTVAAGNVASAGATDPATGLRSLAIITNGANKSSFVQAQAGPFYHTYDNYSMWAPYNFSLTSLGAGGSLSINVPTGVDGTVHNVVVNAMLVNGAYMDYVSWVVTAFTSTDAVVTLTNLHPTATAFGAIAFTFFSYT